MAKRDKNSIPPLPPLREIYDDEGINPLESSEAQAIREEEFSDVDGSSEEQTDPSIVDEEAVYAEMAQEGAGVNIDAEDVQDLGTHIEEPQ